jgi:hypothetical protein
LVQNRVVSRNFGSPFDLGPRLANHQKGKCRPHLNLHALTRDKKKCCSLSYDPFGTTELFYKLSWSWYCPSYDQRLIVKLQWLEKSVKWSVFQTPWKKWDSSLNNCIHSFTTLKLNRDWEQGQRGLACS